MLKQAGILGVSLFAIIFSWTSILSSNTDTEASSLEVRLADGADPTDILEATASGGEIKPFNCDQVVFGKAAMNVKCLVCGRDIAEPTGGKIKVKARILEVLE